MMLSERSRRSALGFYGSGGEVYLMNLEMGSIMSLDGWLDEALGGVDEYRFLIDMVEPQPLDFPVEEHTDEEFEALFEEVPPEALEEAKEHLTRAQKRHMIEQLASEHPELSVAEIAARVGVSTATVRKHIK